MPNPHEIDAKPETARSEISGGTLGRVITPMEQLHERVGILEKQVLDVKYIVDIELPYLKAQIGRAVHLLERLSDRAPALLSQFDGG